MNRWSALAVLVAVAGALALRLPRLDTRPLHNDEGVNALKLAKLWQTGRYVYDPNEFHGPTLYYASLPFVWLSGARDSDQFTETTLRLAPVAFGAALILLLLLFADGLGRGAVVWAGIFTAVSPAMVFYSRYFIHEMLLVFFTALTLGAGWRYIQSRKLGWLLLGGAGSALMYATKETFVFSVLAAGLALVATVVWNNWRAQRSALAANAPRTGLRALAARVNWIHAALALLAGVFMAHLLFSSFFANLAGPIDSVRAYLPWLRRAGGQSPHIHPWFFYFERLGWFHAARGPVWSEAVILALALVGSGVAFFSNRTVLPHPTLPRFLAFYTVVLTAIYCVLSYKTPWCLLGFFHGMILLAGLGAAALVQLCRRNATRAITLAVLAAGVAQLAAQAWRAGFVFASERTNPYVYSQTVPDALNLVHRVEEISRISSAGRETVLKVAAPESDYGPLPWYLRGFKNVGWYDQLPEDPFAPIAIVSAKLDARLDEKSQKKWIMAGMFELRPGNFFELYVEMELWKKFVATLPRETPS